ncbi:fumarylacetoacetate hydrolase family protein [Cohnella pontilimi]|uniref:fumarylacetoacetate hydrolase family protein n=1 Tax=Cohnella pontilimi TaxID=2564100 RepID=UPI001FEA416C|nr:fumarylacetoacetate hydrolase family protein [Cohnella pontilimi]
MDIRNVYCVGRNYRLHAAELGNEVPASPMIFMKPSHAAVSLDNARLPVTGSQGDVHFEMELVFYVARPFESGISPDDLFSHMTVGLDLTLRGVQDVLKAKGHPWLPAKGFRNSAPLGRWLPFSGMSTLDQADFTLLLNGVEAQRGNAGDMVFGLRELAEFVGERYGLGAGDVLFTGTPAGVGSLKDGDRFELRWDGQTIGSGQVSLEV